MNKAKEITMNIKENTNLQKFLLRFLLGSFVILFVFYAYFIGSITFNVLARKTLENTTRSLSSNISKLELTYLDKINQINKDYALSKGFVEVNNNIFATREDSRVARR
jgi:cell division protein FtsB